MHRRSLLGIGIGIGLASVPVWAAKPADAFEGNPFQSVQSFQSFKWPELKNEFLSARARCSSMPG